MHVLVTTSNLLSTTYKNGKVFEEVGQFKYLGSTFIVNRQASQVIIVRPCLPSRNAGKNHTLQGTVDGGRRRGRPRKSSRATSRNGKAIHCRRCCASKASVGVPSDGWASRELVLVKGEQLAQE